MKRLYATVSTNALSVHAETTRNKFETARFPLPEGAFGDGKAMAQAARGFLQPRIKRFRRWEAVILVKTRQAAIRIAADMRAGQSEWTARYFPGGENFNAATHVFAQKKFPAGTNGTDKISAGAGGRWMEALPLALSEALVEMCGVWKLAPHSIRYIGTLEYVLALCQDGSSAEALWLFLPLADGVRLLFLYNGQPAEVFYISRDPSYREAELNRIFLTVDFPAESGQAVLFLEENEEPQPYDWLLDYYSARGCAVFVEAVPEALCRKMAFA